MTWSDIFRKKDGRTACATLLKTKGWKRFVDDSMMNYLESADRCRRKILFYEMELRLHV